MAALHVTFTSDPSHESFKNQTIKLNAVKLQLFHKQAFKAKPQ